MYRKVDGEAKTRLRASGSGLRAVGVKTVCWSESPGASCKGFQRDADERRLHNKNKFFGDSQTQRRETATSKKHTDQKQEWNPTPRPKPESRSLKPRSISTHSIAHSSGTYIARQYSRAIRPSEWPCRERKRSYRRPAERQLCLPWQALRVSHEESSADAKRCCGSAQCEFQFGARVSAQKNGLPLQVCLFSRMSQRDIPVGFE
jgi:hypothetical protein